MTVTATIAAIKALPGMTARRTDGEWRVTFTAYAITEREGVTGRERDERAETLAYYTHDADDALGTAKEMSARWYGDNAPAMTAPEIVSDAAADIVTADGIESGLTGPDWEPTAAERYYAQRVDAPALMAFGATREAAIAALEAGQAEPVARPAVDLAPTLALAVMGPDMARLAVATLDSPPVAERGGIQTDGEGRQFIDMTPTWAEIVPTLLAIVTDGDAKGRAFAREELARMAGLADKFTAARKAFAGLSGEAR